MGIRPLRANFRRAQALLGKRAGRCAMGALRNAQGQAMVLEYMDSNEGGVRTVTPWMRALEKLGITLKFRSVDFALYQQRLQKFDFDITSMATTRAPNNPGQSLPTCLAARRPTWKTPATSRREEPCGGRDDQGHDVGQDRGATAARLPCAGTHHCPQPLPDSAVDGGHAPHGLQRLELARPDAMPPYASGEGWVDRHVVGATRRRRRLTRSEKQRSVCLQRLFAPQPNARTCHPTSPCLPTSSNVFADVSHPAGRAAADLVVVQFVPGPVEQYMAKPRPGWRAAAVPKAAAWATAARRGGPKRLEQIKALYGFRQTCARAFLSDAGPVRAV